MLMNPSTSPLPPAGPTDRSLLRLLRDGSESAAGQLYLRYAQRLYNLILARRSADLARCEDADDIVQSVFGSFFRGVRKGYYEVPAGEELWGLLLIMALNKIRARANFHHAARRDVRRTLGGEALAVESATEESEIGLTVLRLVIDEALRAWPPEHARMIVLRIEGYEVAEIATHTRRSRRTVERVLQEFRRQLTALLDKEE
jgi:RNA polymerase sigma-70 factor (ECF subfamily)